jgi:ATPase subunit of ABC transporter with duplicated ATPase domains
VLRRAEAGLATLEEMGDADWTLETRIEEALARVGLDASGETLLADLSGGQRTRAGLAAAIFAAPDFLFLDEPTNNLDREGRAAQSRWSKAGTPGCWSSAMTASCSNGWTRSLN